MTRASAIIGFQILLTLGCGCQGDLAGTSVGTGNPTEVAVVFRRDGAPAAVAGRLEVYAIDQDPWLDSLPKATFPLESGIARVSVSGLGERWAGADSGFNLVYRDSARREGAFTGRLRLAPPGADSGFTWDGGAAPDTLALDLLGLRTAVGLLDTSLVADTAGVLKPAAAAVFAPGTPFRGRIAGRAFTIPDWIPGRYPLSLFLPDSGLWGAGQAAGTAIPLSPELEADTGAAVYAPAGR